MERSYNVIPTDSGVPIKAWTVGVPFESAAEAQLKNLAALPFIHKWIAVMPDAHQGIGATVGSVVATSGAVIPAAVGVDIGCGMMAARTSLSASRLPDALRGLRSAIEGAVPHGRTDNGGKNDRGAWRSPPPPRSRRGLSSSRGTGRSSRGTRASGATMPSSTSARSGPATTSSSSASTRRTASGSCCTAGRAASATGSGATSSSSPGRR